MPKDMQNPFFLVIPTPTSSSTTSSYCQNNVQSLENVDR